MATFDFSTKTGAIVRIEIDDDSFETEVFDPGRVKIGDFGFDIDDGGLLLTRAFSDVGGDQWIHQGIGREVLKRVKEASGMLIAAEDHDGQRKESGAHLTGNAPAFVAKMRAEGLIVPSMKDRFHEDEED